MTQIKEVRKEVARVLAEDPELKDTLLIHVYDSRQLPGKFNNELCVFSAGNAPEGTALGKPGGSPAYQFIIQWLMKFEDKDQLAVIEDDADDVENAIYRVLLQENYDNIMWRKVVFPNISMRPLAPGGSQNAHFGRLLIRIRV